MASEKSAELKSGVYERLVTAELARRLEHLDPALRAASDELLDAEAGDRISRHLAALIQRTIESGQEKERVELGALLADAVIAALKATAPEELGLDDDALDSPARLLRAIHALQPDGSEREIRRPLTPLLDTTLLTNAHGEPSISHELRSEIDSADSIDILMAFVRWSGVGPMAEELRRFTESGKRVRLITTTYTNSTQKEALDRLVDECGVEVKVSYDLTSTRLHAKAWIFRRTSGYSTAYLGSSNLTFQAQTAGLEWNVRVAQARNGDVLDKMSAVFETYWANPDFRLYDPVEFTEATAAPERGALVLSPFEVHLYPFQERLLERIALARQQGHHRNLLVSATGTGKTVMAAMDYARQRRELPRARLLFVAHRERILNQARLTFAHVLRDAAFGEMWVDGQRPARFEHVFASIQSLSASDITNIDPNYFDVVIIDEFHHAAARTYRELLDRLQPVELLGLTATPERADAGNILGYFDDRVAAELRIWDAIDQQYLVPFTYYGVHDDTDLRSVTWRRGQGYDVTELSNVFTGNDVWVGKVLEQLRRRVIRPTEMRALGFCVDIAHAKFMADRFTKAGLNAVALWADTPTAERTTAIDQLDRGELQAIFTVDLFNEGVDIPAVDTLLLLRPTDSALLFLQQLGRGLRKYAGKADCTVLDFVALHRKEFRFDKKLRALLGGTRNELVRQVEQGFPFLPAGCSMQLDPYASKTVLDNIRTALPTRWAERVREMQALGDVSLGRFLDETGLDLADIYSGNHSFTELRREAGLPTLPAGRNEGALLRAVGRLDHVDDPLRLRQWTDWLRSSRAPQPTSEADRRLLRMLVGSLAPLGGGAPFDESVTEVWSHEQVRGELVEMLEYLAGKQEHLSQPLGLERVPLMVGGRYSRIEILSAFGVGDATTPPQWQQGARWLPSEHADLFAFTLDKTRGGFSPTTRYRDYAISRELIHWESQNNTREASEKGQRYIHHGERDNSIVLFARLRADDRAFWCLGPAIYVSHQGERPISFTWRLHHPMPADLFQEFSAAVA